MARRYQPKAYRPAHGSVRSLKFTRVYRCTKPKCGMVHEHRKPTQCHCGSIEFEHFHSKSEAHRYATLLLLQDRGKISNLRKQVRFDLHTVSPGGLKTKVCTYIADFEYDDEDGKRVVNEHKGLMTPVANLKMKWFEAEYGIRPLYTK